LNLAPEAVERALTSRTRAIMPVHLYGNPCDMPEINRIARAHGLAVLEDACQAHGARIDGQRIGSTGTACFSFYPTKNMTSGEGGMICTSDPQLADTARVLRSHGMRQRYWHEALGHNFRMTDIHAAVGLAQLRRLDSFNTTRAANAAYYDAHLSSLERPAVYPGAEPVWHQYTLRAEPDRRDALVAYIGARGVGVGIYYPVPAHRQPIIEQLGITADCPAAEAAAASVLSIPVHPGVGEEERAHVALEVNRACLEA
jgi:perosamine synthetase